MYGKKGIWRAEETYVYQVNRDQNGDLANSFKTKIDIDGEYESWQPFDWLSSATNPTWDWISKITMYSPYGFQLEQENRLSYSDANESLTTFTSQLYGYENSVVTAGSANASYFEIGYNGFEQESTYADRGHLALYGTNTMNICDSISHTGGQSLDVQTGKTVKFLDHPITSSNEELKGENNKDYIVSLWVNVEENGAIGTLIIGSDTISTDDVGEIIDGWVKLELKFTMGSVNQEVQYISTGQTVY